MTFEEYSASHTFIEAQQQRLAKKKKSERIAFIFKIVYAVFAVAFLATCIIVVVVESVVEEDLVEVVCVLIPIIPSLFSIHAENGGIEIKPSLFESERLWLNDKMSDKWSSFVRLGVAEVPISIEYSEEKRPVPVRVKVGEEAVVEFSDWHGYFTLGDALGMISLGLCSYIKERSGRGEVISEARLTVADAVNALNGKRAPRKPVTLKLVRKGKFTGTAKSLLRSAEKSSGNGS